MEKKHIIFSLVIVSMMVSMTAFTGCLQNLNCVRTITVKQPNPNPPDFVQSVQDQQYDLLLVHPEFEQIYGWVPFDNYDYIPQAFDIDTVQIEEEGSDYYVYIETHDEIPNCFEFPQGQFAIYIDKDHNGWTDLILTTTSTESCMVLDPNLEIIGDAEMYYDSNIIRFIIPGNLVSDNFDWLVFSGYSPEQNVVYQTHIPEVFFVPQVDVVTSQQSSQPQQSWNRVGIQQCYRGQQDQCQVTGTAYTTCPTYAPEDAIRDVPGTSYTGVRIFKDICGDLRGREWWCIMESSFGLRVLKGLKSGWVGRCPFAAGQNRVDWWDEDGDKLPDVLFHTVYDGYDPYNYRGDDDGDGRLDVYNHTYYYSSDLVYSVHTERDYTTGGELWSDNYSPVHPYSNPYDVPP